MHKLFAKLKGFKLYNFTGCGPRDHNIFVADFDLDYLQSTIFKEFVDSGDSNAFFEGREAGGYSGNGLIEDIYLNKSEPNY